MSSQEKIQKQVNEDSKSSQGKTQKPVSKDSQISQGKTQKSGQDKTKNPVSKDSKITKKLMKGPFTKGIFVCMGTDEPCTVRRHIKETEIGWEASETGVHSHTDVATGKKKILESCRDFKS